MPKNLNHPSFVLCISCLFLSVHSLHAAIHHTWSVAPPLLVLWFLSVYAFILEKVNSDAQKNRLAKLKSRLILFNSFSLSIFLLLALVFNFFTKESIKTAHSPDGNYTINFYTQNGGAVSSINVIGIIDGPLWFHKTIYHDRNMHKVDVEWITNNEISINNHVLNLNKEDIFSN